MCITNAKINNFICYYYTILNFRFFAGGSYQLGCGQDFFAAFAQSTFSNSQKEVMDILEELCEDWINFHMSDQEKDECKLFFYEKSNFPGVIGCIDGTHIKILKPQADEHIYFNRKGDHSMNVMVVCKINIKKIIES